MEASNTHKLFSNDSTSSLLKQNDSEQMDDCDEELINMSASRLELISEGTKEMPKCRTSRTSRNVSNSSNEPNQSIENSYNESAWKLSTNGIPKHDSPWCETYPSCDSDNDVPLLQGDENSLNNFPLDDSHCPVQRPTSNANSKARNQLLISSALCIVFMIAEVVGGYLSGSLSIMADAAHMLSDLASFMVSLFALWLGNKPPTKKMSFGYHRAEILGALASVILVWCLSGILVYTAVLRAINQDFDIKADIMIITASIGIVFNLIMGSVLHSCCHCLNFSPAVGHSHSSHSHSDNINVRAAFIHVLGDLVQSVGVLIAAIIIKFEPTYQLADLICTFLFSAMVLLTTRGIFRDAIYILMEGFPKEVNYVSVKFDLESIEGVKRAHSLQVWSLTLGKHALIAHLALDENINANLVVKQAEGLMKEKYHLVQTTFQTELHTHSF